MSHRVEDEFNEREARLHKVLDSSCFGYSTYSEVEQQRAIDMQQELLEARERRSEEEMLRVFDAKLHEQWFGPPNQCGSCVLCCKLQAIPALKKERNVLCKHAKEGCICGGCQIYSTRPEACRTYSCLWLAEELPAELKPNKIGACFEYTGNHEVVNLRCEPFRFNTLWGDRVIMAEIKRRLADDVKVILTDGKRASIFVRDEARMNWALLRGHLRGQTEAGDENIFDFREVIAQGTMGTES